MLKLFNKEKVNKYVYLCIHIYKIVYNNKYVQIFEVRSHVSDTRLQEIGV